MDGELAELYAKFDRLLEETAAILVALSRAVGTINGVPHQGQHTLNCSSSNDLQQVVVVPTATAAFHGQARGVRMLLQE